MSWKRKKLIVAHHMSDVKNSISAKVDQLMDGMISHPYRSLFICSLILGSLLRIVFSLNSTGLYHPDELFQSIEPAHYVTYGYGFLPPEFKNSVPNEKYYARSRSWVFPLFFVVILKFGDLLGLNYYHHTLPLIYLIGGINSILLILAARHFTEVYLGNKNAGYMAGTLVALWPRLLHLSFRLFTNTFPLPLLVLSLTVAIKYVRGTQELTVRDKLFLAVGMGTFTYVRLDFLAVVFFMALTELVQITWREHLSLQIGNYRRYPEIAYYSLLGWILGMVVDYLMYESSSPRDLIAVPLNWFGFNFIEGKSAIFGVDPFGYYFRELIVKDGLLTTLGISASLLVLLSVVSGRVGDGSPRPRESLLQLFHLMKLYVVSALVWLVYESPFDAGISFRAVSHKEFRFITNGLLLVVICIGSGVVILSDTAEIMIEKRISSPSRITYSTAAKFVIIVILLVGLIGGIQSSRTRFPIESHGDIIEAQHWLGENADDLAGVIIFEHWFNTGAYSHLHRNVTITWLSNLDSLHIMRVYLENSAANYLIVPQYQYENIPGLYDLIAGSDFSLLTVVKGSAEIWSLSD